jgi:hypothetical protein
MEMIRHEKLMAAMEALVDVVEDGREPKEVPLDDWVYAVKLFASTIAHYAFAGFANQHKFLIYVAGEIRKMVTEGSVVGER